MSFISINASAASAMTMKQILKHQKDKKYNTIYTKAVNILSSSENKNLKPESASAAHSFSLTKTGLRQLEFNVVQPSYYENTVASLKTISDMQNITTQFGLPNPSVIAQLSNVNQNIYRNVNSTVSQMKSATNSEKVLYNMIGNYYQNGLISRFGTLQTSLLKKVGIYSNIDISYNTILEKTNIFLSKISDSKSNLYRFDTLFNSKFSKITMKDNYIPNVMSFNTSAFSILARSFGVNTAFGLNSSVVSPGNAAYDMALSWAQYPEINLKSVNFFSVSYFLIKDSLNNNKADSRMLRNIIMGRYDKALKEFYSIKTIHTVVKHNYISAFLNAKNYKAKEQIAQETYDKAYSILPGVYVHKYSPTYNMVIQREGKAKIAYGENLLKAYYLMKIILINDKQKDNWTPWASANKNINKVEILKLWSLYQSGRRR